MRRHRKRIAVLTQRGADNAGSTPDHVGSRNPRQFLLRFCVTLQESVQPETMGVSMSWSINYGTRCTFPLGLFKDPFHFRPPSSAQLDTSAMVDAAVEVALEALGLVCAHRIKFCMCIKLKSYDVPRMNYEIRLSVVQ